jgi:Spy/CpxP family protein refolding chaperone
MNALNRWKIVLALIATFAAGAATSMFLTVRATNYETQRNEPRPGAPFALDGRGARLRLTPEQDQKLRPIVQQADDELSNLYALNLRETNGILDRAQDRMSPFLQPDQRAKLQKLIEERERRIEQWFTLPASPLP